MYNCLLCEAKEGRNLSFGSGLMELCNHNSTRREDINNCLLCVGKDKNGLNLSLDPSKLQASTSTVESTWTWGALICLGTRTAMRMEVQGMFWAGR